MTLFVLMFTLVFVFVFVSIFVRASTSAAAMTLPFYLYWFDIFLFPEN